METWGIFWGFVIVFAFYDGNLDWSEGNGLNHTFRAFARLSFIFLLSFYDYGFDAYYTAGAFKLACYRFSLFWIVFDPMVNLIHFRTDVFRFGDWRKIFHLGSTAFLDWVFRAAWGVQPAPEKTVNRRNEIGAVVTQYVFKALFLIVFFQWSTFTSDTYLF